MQKISAEHDLLADCEGQYAVLTDKLAKIDTKIYKEHGGEINNFSLTFDKTGRYEIEFFDSTYTSGFTYANHYETSFFIREKGSESSIFQNS